MSVSVKRYTRRKAFKNLINVYLKFKPKEIIAKRPEKASLMT